MQQKLKVTSEGRSVLGTTTDSLRRRVEVGPRKYGQHWWIDFGFDDDSDVGSYELEIFANGTLVRRVAFEVFSPTRDFKPRAD
jgi:hypothetical protein